MIYEMLAEHEKHWILFLNKRFKQCFATIYAVPRTTRRDHTAPGGIQEIHRVLLRVHLKNYFCSCLQQHKNYLWFWHSTQCLQPSGGSAANDLMLLAWQVPHGLRRQACAGVSICIVVQCGGGPGHARLGSGGAGLAAHAMQLWGHIHLHALLLQSLLLILHLLVL